MNSDLDRIQGRTFEYEEKFSTLVMAKHKSVSVEQISDYERKACA
jgi:hypothetical protein